MDFVKECIQKMTKISELEIRLGTFQKNSFCSGITREKFDEIKSTFKNPKEYKILDTFFNNCEYRQRRINSDKSIWIKKVKRGVRDLHEKNIRISLCDEKESDFKNIIKYYKIKDHETFFAPENVSIIRKKMRLTEKFIGYCKDLTFVENFVYKDNKWVSMSKLYEYEIEIQTDKANIEHILSSFETDYYYSLVKCKNFIGNQPITLERKDIPNIQKGYSVTDKVDGIRMFLINWGNKLYLLDKKLIQTPLGIETETNGFLLDGEYSNNKFMAFDILYYDGDNCCKFHLPERHILMDRVIKKLNSDKIQPKTFYYSEDTENKPPFVKYTENLFETAKDLWKRDNEHLLDGLIFTPLYEDYSRFTKIFKWKETPTVDVLVRDGEMYGNNRGNIEKININCENLENNKIYEFARNKQGLWYKLHDRPDKKFPNAILTIKSAIKAIDENISLDDLNNNIGTQYNTKGKQIHVRKTENDIGYRSIHNKIKNEIIKLNNNNGTVIDLGCGKLGDLFKYEKAGYTELLAIDLSWQHIYGENGAIQRYEKIKNDINMKVTIIWGDVCKNIRSGEAGCDDTNVSKLKQFFKEHKRFKFDTVSCQFAIHYLVKSELFVKNVQLLLKSGGLFIGTFLNKNKIKEGKYNKDGTVIYEIKNITENTVDVKTLQWENFITESTIDEQTLKDAFKFKKITFRSFTEYGFNTGNPDENALIAMHDTFVFVK